jgi:hypothetical protein
MAHPSSLTKIIMAGFDNRKWHDDGELQYHRGQSARLRWLTDLTSRLGLHQFLCVEHCNLVVRGETSEISLEGVGHIVRTIQKIWKNYIFSYKTECRPNTCVCASLINRNEKSLPRREKLDHCSIALAAHYTSYAVRLASSSPKRQFVWCHYTFKMRCTYIFHHYLKV